MKRILLTVSAVFLALSWICEADASGKEISVTFCDQSTNRCGYIGIDGKMYDWDDSVLDAGNNKKGFYSAGYKILTNSTDYPFTYYGSISGDALNAVTFGSDGGWVKIATNGELQECATNYGCWSTGHNNVVDAERGALLPDSMAYVNSDGTSNLCPGSDNVKIWVSDIQGFSQGRATSFICKKTDGSYVSSGNIPNYVSPAGSKEITTYPTSSYIPGELPRYVYVNSDDTLTGINITVKTGKWRNPRILTDNSVCAVSLNDSKFKCWDSSGSIFKTSGNSVLNLNPTPPGPTVGPSASTCRTINIPNTSATSWINPGFFDIPGGSNAFRWTEGTSPIPAGCSNSSLSQWAGATKCGDVGTLAQMDSSGNLDRVTVYNYYTGTTLVPDSFTASGTSRSLLIRDDETGVPVMKFGAMRDGVPYAANVWQFFGVQNPSTQRNWAYEIGADGSSTPVYATGGQATIVYAGGRSAVVLQLNETAVAPKGMRIGVASGSVSKTQCENARTACEWTRATFDGAFSCTPILKNGAYGECSVQNGFCAPTGTGTVTPSENATITYGPNGEILNVSAPNPSLNPDGTIRSADVFSCPNTPPGFSNWLDCILEVTSNVWNLIGSNTSNLTGDGSGSVIGVANKIGNTSGELSFTGVAPNGVNLADNVFRGTWNEAFVGTENSPFRGFGTFALVIAVVLLIIAAIGAIALAASKR